LARRLGRFPDRMAQAQIEDSTETKSLALGHHDAAQPVSTTRDASDPAPVTQDFRYLIYYVWSELPPAQKPADIVLSSLKETLVGTPVEEIKRASDAFGLDSNFMKAVARIESGFDPKQRTGSYIGLFQLSEYEFNKFGSGQIRNPRDNAVAAAYKVITEGILFEWVTHQRPTLSDLYLIHQQGWEGAAEHISQPDRIAWKSMCATSEGREKGEKWCKRAIWRNTLPAIKHAWKSVDKLTSGAFVGMWRERVAEFYSKYIATAAAERANK
jgi:Transglycosylase SLT domain